MEFSGAHAEDLVRRVVSPGEMTEMFGGRDDFLHYRHVVFDHHVQFLKPESDTDLDIDVYVDPDFDPDDQPLKKVVERFHRNRSKPANEDVAERVFLLAQGRIEVTYHLEDHRFIPSKRSFIKPREIIETRKIEDFTPHMVSSFQVDPSEKPLNTLALYEMLVVLMEAEEKVVLQIKKSKKEVRDILDCREQEEGNIQLHYSPWTTAGAAMARNQRQKMEDQAAEEQRWLQEKEKELLAPFLIRLDNPKTLTPEDANQLYQDCMAEFKQRIEEQTNFIQERYEKLTQELQRKQQWYQENQLNMTRKQESEYQTYCSEKILQIRVAKKRMSMQKEEAHQKHLHLSERLKQAPQLAPHQHTFSYRMI